MINRNDISEVINEVLESRRGIEAELHVAHHRWIEERIAAEKERREMYKKIRDTVIQWSVVGLLTTAAAYMGLSVHSGGQLK